MSPTVRLTAYRPPSSTGAGFAILIRRGGSLRFGAGISPWSIHQVHHMNLSRTSGVQLHPTSLPSGRLGPDAYAWVDWLASAGQTWWQMLPLGPPDEHDSPYKSASAFAASPRLLARPRRRCPRAEQLDFRERASDWIEDWLAFAGEDALDDQVRFDREWAALRVLRRGAGREADRRHPDLRRARLRRPAGAPGDLQGRRGRRRAAGRLHRQGPAVGQPAVRLARAAALGYAWWIARFKRVFELFDLARIDHFRGFCAYWAVPADAEFALSGTWKRGPGARRSTRRARCWASCR